VAWAKLVERDNGFNEGGVRGPGFAQKWLPRLAEFFARVGEEMAAMDRAA
jgi:hypothetical protein